MFAPIADKKELMLSALDPASRLGSIEERMCLALEKCLKLGAGRSRGMRICASLENKSPCCLTAKKLLSSAQKDKQRCRLLREANAATKDHRDLRASMWPPRS